MRDSESERKRVFALSSLGPLPVCWSPLISAQEQVFVLLLSLTVFKELINFTLPSASREARKEPEYGFPLSLALIRVVFAANETGKANSIIGQ